MTPPLVQRVPRWKKILLQIFRGGSVLAGPGAATAAGAAIVQTIPAAVETTENLGIAGEWVHHAVEARFSSAAADEAANTAIEMTPATEEERTEFKNLVKEAFQTLREQSAEIAKDIVKDLTKDAVELYVLVKIARRVVNKLRSKPANPIAKRMADVLDKLIAHKAEEPAGKAPAEITPQESQAAHRLAGYELRGGIWIPLGLEK